MSNATSVYRHAGAASEESAIMGAHVNNAVVKTILAPSYTTNIPSCSTCYPDWLKEGLPSWMALDFTHRWQKVCDLGMAPSSLL